jgi:hypothetical protein
VQKSRGAVDCSVHTSERNAAVSVEKNGRSGKEADEVGSCWQRRSKRRGRDLCD